MKAHYLLITTKSKKFPPASYPLISPSAALGLTGAEIADIGQLDR